MAHPYSRRYPFSDPRVCSLTDLVAIGGDAPREIFTHCASGVEAELAMFDACASLIQPLLSGSGEVLSVTCSTDRGHGGGQRYTVLAG